MIKDQILEYWTEMVESSLEDIGKLDSFTPADIKALAEDMVITADQESVAFGYDAIPNPQTTMIEDLKESYKLSDTQRDHTERILIQKIADIQKISSRDIYVENGQVKYLTRFP